MQKTILFDMDGLLVDSEHLGIQVAVEVCRDLGLDITEEEQRGFIGVTDEKFYRELFKKYQKHVDIDEVLTTHFEVYEKLLETSLVPFEGAKTLPFTLKERGHKLAVVSGSTTHQINLVLQGLGITECFEATVSCDEIQHSKPDPEGYLKGAAKLDVSPGNCIVLEDAETGISAGKRAGMNVIAVVNAGGQDLSEADVVVSNLTEIEQNLQLLD